jgi:pyridoxal 5'-phosphate synthase pdxT subunit
MLANEATATKKGGQELIGGLDVRVHRNHFGRQRESFITNLNLDFLQAPPTAPKYGRPAPFPAVFIRAPVVDKLLAHQVTDDQSVEALNGDIIRKSSRIQVLATLQAGANSSGPESHLEHQTASGDTHGAIVALRQGNIFGTSFHPELTDDFRIHKWWLDRVVEAFQ